jgi:hypothetical protein
MSVSMLFKEEMMVVLKKVVKDICEHHDLDYMEECRRLDMVDLDVVSVVSKEVVSKEVVSKEVVSKKVVSEVKEVSVKDVVSEEVVGEKTYRGRFPLPYNGEKREECCDGLTHNYGLMTQCYSKKKVGEEYCGNCKKKADKEANGMPTYGNIKERMKVGIEEYVAPNGERPEKYLAVLKKLNLSKERALEEASKMSMKIAEVHLAGADEVSVPVSVSASVSAPTNDKKGRAKSEVKKAVSEVKGSRGRPKKEVSDVKLDEEVDYFAQAIAEYEAEKEADKEVEKVAEKVAEKEADKEVEKEVEKEAEEEAEEEEIHVTRIEYEGKKYLKSSQGIIYDAITQDEVGEWDHRLEKVVFFPVEEEEEDEYVSE